MTDCSLYSLLAGCAECAKVITYTHFLTISLTLKRDRQMDTETKSHVRGTGGKAVVRGTGDPQVAAASGSSQR